MNKLILHALNESAGARMAQKMVQISALALHLLMSLRMFENVFKFIADLTHCAFTCFAFRRYSLSLRPGERCRHSPVASGRAVHFESI